MGVIDAGVLDGVIVVINDLLGQANVCDYLP
jgi:hypothetical protein